METFLKSRTVETPRIPQAEIINHDLLNKDFVPEMPRILTLVDLH